jgi:hypothetical protein
MGEKSYFDINMKAIHYQNILLTIFLSLFVSFVSYGQNINNIFKSTKGQWSFPISSVESIDTIDADCYGFPANSLNLVLRTNYPQIVKAIQPGLVVSVRNYGDSPYWVMVKSGDYFLVYSGLSNPNVCKGDTIIKNYEIGSLAQDESEGCVYSLGLILYNGTKVININRWFKWTAKYPNIN